MTRITQVEGAFKVTVLMLVVLVIGRPARAQSQQNDVSSGYLNVSGSMHGMSVQLSSQRTRRLSLVGQIDWSRGPDPDSTRPIYHDVGGLAGIRFSSRDPGPDRPLIRGRQRGCLGVSAHSGRRCREAWQMRR